MAQVKAHFRPEFINRIDEVVVFNALGTEEIRKIAQIQIDKLASASRRRILSLRSRTRPLTPWPARGSTRSTVRVL